MNKTLIIAPPPTPNGDLHVGHMAGPYLAADIYARHLRQSGRPVNYATGTDDSQTYVVTSAEKLDVSPAQLCKKSWSDIKTSLEVWGVQLDGYAPFDDQYHKMVIDFLVPLFDAGKFKLKTVKLPFSESRQEFQVESFVSGECPICLSNTRGGLCESCGHPNNFGMLKSPKSTRAPFEELVYKEVDILVFPIEEYRAKLEEYYSTKQGKWRPHILQLMRELLDSELIDFPITYPVSWGIKSPFPGTEGQVINAWAEGMAASMYCSHCGEDGEVSIDESWKSEHQSTLVYFLGFDNSYFWGVTHLCLLMAHEGKYILPSYIVPNEFYELENAKFSTSRGHLVWAQDLVKELPRDYARFYLCLTCPEHSRSNFSKADMIEIISERLINAWNALVLAYNGFTSTSQGAPSADALLSMKKRLELAFDINTFSLRRASDWALQNIERIEGALRNNRYTSMEAANAEVALLLQGMGSIMIDFHAKFVADNAAALQAGAKEKLCLEQMQALVIAKK